MKTDKSPLLYEQHENTNQNAREINGELRSGFEYVVDHQMGAQLRRSQRAKNPWQMDQTLSSTVTERINRPQRKANNVSYAESSSDDSIASEFSDVNIETRDAGIERSSKSHSSANLIISHGREAATTSNASQSQIEVAGNRRVTPNTSRKFYNGSAHGKSKDSRRDGSRGMPHRGKLISKYTCL